jgi:hypothetical protein
MNARRRLLLSVPILSVASLLSAVPAVAEIPQTTAEWLALYNQRRNNTYSVRLECTWQSLVEGKLVEEWDQVFLLDDFGGKRIEEFGRVRGGLEPNEARFLTDAVYAFDGNEYREFTEYWRIEGNEPLNRERKEAIRRAGPSSKGGWVESEPGELATINDTLTPLKLADYWFGVCLTNAQQEGIEPLAQPVEDRPGVWRVTLESQNKTIGHKCRAVVNEAQDARVEQVDLWHEGAWIQTCEGTYVEEFGRWRLVTGNLIGRSLPRPDGSVRVREQRVTVHKTTFSGPSGEVVTLPAFPAGTALTDQRSGAAYRVGSDASVEPEIAQLSVEGRQKLAELQARRGEYFRWPTQLRLAVWWAVAGVLTGLVAVRLWRAAVWLWRTIHRPGHERSRHSPSAESLSRTMC